MFMANPISKVIKYINKSGEEKEIILYDNPTSFSDYDGGTYIAVQADESTVGYIYCNSKLPKDTTTHFASFIDKNNNLRYAYTEEPTQSIAQSIKYTFTTGYDVMPQINGVVYSSKYKDTINRDGTTTRTLLIDEPITQISFYGITNGNYLVSFDECSDIKLTTCANIFKSCYSLTSVNLSNFDTSNVSNMSYMFSGCIRLTSLNISNFNTSNVTDMSYMFGSCSKLTSLNVSNFNTSNVTNMSSMFENCSKLTSLKASNFNTSNVTDMSYMFSYCKSLTSLDIRNFSSIKLSSYGSMLNSVNSTCKVYVKKYKFTKTASECGFRGSFTYV